MKTILSSKILTFSFSLSIILCSLSLLIFSIGSLTEAKAEIKDVQFSKTASPWDDNLRGAVGLGIAKDTAYFVVWGNPNLFYKAAINKAEDWYTH